MTKDRDVAPMSFDYKLREGLHSGELQLVDRDAELLRALFGMAVVHVEGKALADYYGEIFEHAVRRLRVVAPVASRRDYVAHVVHRLDGELAALREPGRLVEVRLQDLDEPTRAQARAEIGRLQFHGCALPDEGMAHHGLCRLRGGQVGPIPDGTVFVRRVGPIATAVWLAGALRFADGKVVVARGEPQPGPAPQARGEHIVVPPTPGDKQTNLVDSLTAICDVLSCLPGKVGTVFGVLNKVGALAGTLTASAPDFDLALQKVETIMKTELTRQAVTQQLQNIHAWADRLHQHHAVIEKFEQEAVDRVEIAAYIVKVYLPEVMHQLEAASGTVLNSVYQLKGQVGTVAKEDMDLREEVLKALVYALGHLHIIYREQVLLNAQVAISLDDPSYRRAAQAAHVQYETAVLKSSVTPYAVAELIYWWKVDRGTNLFDSVYNGPRYSHDPCHRKLDVPNHSNGNITSYCKEGFLVETYVVYDKGRNSQELVWCDWVTTSVHAGHDWARARVDQYQRVIDDEVKLNLIPLENDCYRMVTAFTELTLE